MKFKLSQIFAMSIKVSLLTWIGGISAAQNDSKIVHGKPARPGQFPYQAAIIRNNSLMCGGSIYSEATIITAAHCCDAFKISDTIEVWTNFWKLTQPKPSRQSSPVASFKQHPNFNTYTLENDICLLTLSEKFTLDDTNGPKAISLNREEEVDDGTLCTISGWGTTQSGGYIANILQWVQVPLVNFGDCSTTYEERGKITLYEEAMICAGGQDKDTCQGDSGGPMVCNGYLTGITSFGIGCGIPGIPGVYTKVSSYVDWVERNSAKALTPELASIFIVTAYFLYFTV